MAFRARMAVRTLHFSLPFRSEINLFVEFRVAASGMAWKGVDTEGVVAMGSSSIKWAQWLRAARNFQLRVGIKEEKGDFRKETFDGFLREVCLLNTPFLNLNQSGYLRITIGWQPC